MVNHGVERQMFHECSNNFYLIKVCLYVGVRFTNIPGSDNVSETGQREVSGQEPLNRWSRVLRSNRYRSCLAVWCALSLSLCVTFMKFVNPSCMALHMLLAVSIPVKITLGRLLWQAFTLWYTIFIHIDAPAAIPVHLLYCCEVNTRPWAIIKEFYDYLIRNTGIGHETNISRFFTSAKVPSITRSLCFSNEIVIISSPKGRNSRFDHQWISTAEI